MPSCVGAELSHAPPSTMLPTAAPAGANPSLANNDSIGIPQHFDFNMSTGYVGDELRRLLINLLVLSTIMLFLRLGTRAFIVKHFGVDDLMGTVAWVGLVAISMLDMHSENLFYQSRCGHPRII
jgi:hypothetical protein